MDTQGGSIYKQSSKSCHDFLFVLLLVSYISSRGYSLVLSLSSSKSSPSGVYCGDVLRT